MPHPHVPAAFINAIAEEGTKNEAIEWLQKQWNETCVLRAALTEIAVRCERAAHPAAPQCLTFAHIEHLKQVAAKAREALA